MNMDARTKHKTRNRVQRSIISVEIEVTRVDGWPLTTNSVLTLPNTTTRADAKAWAVNMRLHDEISRRDLTQKAERENFTSAVKEILNENGIKYTDLLLSITNSVFKKR